ncbi:MAG: DUF4388 domain-containing protein [Acidobacteria bacterium]|jgi:hypothetical protein|nr:DUF4388 domain-containing protein [Acidobacteriota bacterium]
MALEGTLRDFSFADILQLISLQRKTGVLTLRAEDNVVTVAFQDGCIVGASTLNQHTEDMIGLILLKRGEVTEVELEGALRRQEETLQRLGRILIDHHVVPVETVRVALHQQILQIVYRVFRWSDGEYHFSQETDIDYDRDLLQPMAADSIIMEGARMTDEWPFIDQRIPDRDVVFRKVDPSRRLEVVAGSDDLLGDLEFSFDGDEKGGSESLPDDQITENQMAVYPLINGRDSVSEIILESTLIEFETCKAIAELFDRGLIRESTQEEIAREMRQEVEEPATERWPMSSLPWLAVPFLILLGFALMIVQRNPANPGFHLREDVWDRYVLQSVSWISLDRIARQAETAFYLDGVYPASADQLAAEYPRSVPSDPWGRPYRLVERGEKLLVTGADSDGQPIQNLILSRHLAWEGATDRVGRSEGPGVELLP